MSKQIIKPRGVITSKDAEIMDQAFNERYAAMSKCIGKDDNRSSWWSLDDMRNFLDYAENQAKSLGYTMDGVRVYEGAHGEKGYTSMFIAPTGSKGTGGSRQAAGSGDIPGGDVLNAGSGGNPPSANYPQQ